ncbi:hypothetical protein [Asaia bogorensis]|uniref:Uncharacterized protein n=1 Tax=Asaia bogorensis NBRC 16594 TaxID=1231624 RepID=A0AAN4R1J7_9PROT|nr:hypothetical protein [Asaia bogorensis]MDR6182415.1 hypothetical protein [Asaia bogorensis NBRC 16594]BAT20014.1 hypothetical protein Asbog_01752 [Asaia bogorensis NBRC 16594]GBQ80764.1 hypothetical protein AA0311_2439 [Asaia bogorensis NBRC 16594]GEL52568.1 hypothetical protein ABO01nite_05750 [Asaia bogorensis NBRC 16594]
MRKETLLVFGFLAVVLSTVALIWYFAWPALRPVRFETVSDVTLTIEQTNQTRKLDAAETAQLNEWLHSHTHGWAPLTSPAPSTGDVVIKAHLPDGEPFELALWTGISGADWNDTAITRANPKARFKVQSFDDQGWAPLRRLIEGQGFEKTDVP